MALSKNEQALLGLRWLTAAFELVQWYDEQCHCSEVSPPPELDTIIGSFKALIEEVETIAEKALAGSEVAPAPDLDPTITG